MSNFDLNAIILRGAELTIIGSLLHRASDQLPWSWSVQRRLELLKPEAFQMSMLRTDCFCSLCWILIRFQIAMPICEDIKTVSEQNRSCGVSEQDKSYRVADHIDQGNKQVSWHSSYSSILWPGMTSSSPRSIFSWIPSFKEYEVFIRAFGVFMGLSISGVTAHKVP